MTIISITEAFARVSSSSTFSLAYHRQRHALLNTKPNFDSALHILVGGRQSQSLQQTTTTTATASTIRNHHTHSTTLLASTTTNPRRFYTSSRRLTLQQPLFFSSSRHQHQHLSRHGRLLTTAKESGGKEEEESSPPPRKSFEKYDFDRPPQPLEQEVGSLIQNDATTTISNITIPGSQTGGRKLAIIYTCAVCETRSAKQFTEKAYLQGVVLVRCPGCHNLHLIADRLGYFGDKNDGDWDLEKIAAQRGESFKKVTDEDEDDVLELNLEDIVGKEKMEDLLRKAEEKLGRKPT